MADAYTDVTDLANTHLMLDDTTGTVCVNSGPEANGTFTQMTAADGTVVSLTTRGGTAIEFDGTEHVVGAGTGLARVDQSLTLIIKTTDNTGYAAAAKDGVNGNLCIFVTAEGYVQMVIGHQSLQTFTTLKVNDGASHHVALVYDAGLDEARCYIDGTLSASETPVTGILSANIPLVLACRGDTLPATKLHLRCILDEVMTFPILLTTGQITTLAGAVEVAPPAPTPTGMFAASDATGSGDGSEGSPWTIFQAVTANVAAGTTIWLRGGTYKTSQTNGLRVTASGGTDSQPIVYRSYPEEWAILDTYLNTQSVGDAYIFLLSDYVTFRDIEFFSSRPSQRWTDDPDPNASDSDINLQRGQLFNDTTGSKFINCISHDIINGYASNSGDTGGGIWGCIFYNNGFIFDDGGIIRGQDHGIYVQNGSAGNITKTIHANLSFDNFNSNFIAYGSGSSAHVSYFHISDNTFFNTFNQYGRNILIGCGPQNTTDFNTAIGNSTYDIKGVTEINREDQLGLNAAANGWTYTDNVNGSGTFDIEPIAWTNVTGMNNLTVGKTEGDMTGWGVTVRTISAQASLGPLVRVTASLTDEFRFPGGYGHVSIHNYRLDVAVDVNLAAILTDGASFKVWHAYDVQSMLGNGSAQPVLEGMFLASSPTVSIPMGTKTAPVALGDLGGFRTPVEQSPEFGAFIVTSSSTAPPVNPETEFWASSTATPGVGDGSVGNPWTLDEALSNTTDVTSGNTVYLLGGTYTGTHLSLLTGSSGSPILVRPHEGDQVIIDLQGGNDFTFSGSYTHFLGLEITNLAPGNRVSNEAGDTPSDIDINQSYVYGNYNKIINCVIHDLLGTGISLWASSSGSEVYGCLIYNNGWSGPDSGHGHGVETQNDEDIDKLFTQNAIYNNFADNFIASATSGNIKDYLMVGNTIFNAGAALGVGYLAATDYYAFGAGPGTAGGHTHTRQRTFSENAGSSDF